MKRILLHPTYFPNIGHMIALWNAGEITFEIHDHFEKQTYRNRMIFLGAHGRQILSVPVQHAKSLQRRPTHQVKVVNDTDWQRHHWKSLETAYRSSPYFEYYEDDLMPLFDRRFDSLVELNLATIEKIFELLGRPLTWRLTGEYQPQAPQGVIDLRPLVRAKQKHHYIDRLEPYTQVFTDRHPFAPDLSFLDLLFMQGPASVLYLEKHAPLVLK